jgi:AcrR family transcriptional regulator
MAQSGSKKTQPQRTKQAAPTAEKRRVPTQDRSRQRVERILDAAARVFAEHSYEATTTEAIASAAGTSIGSLYQFFPNKRAVFDAIARRYLERSRALFDTLVTPAVIALPWGEMLDRGIDLFFQLNRHDPDFRAIWSNWHLSGSFLVAGQALSEDFVRRIQGVIALKAKALSPERQTLVAAIVVEAATAMLLYAVRSRVAAPEALVAETKILLHRYLEPYAKDS